MELVTTIDNQTQMPTRMKDFGASSTLLDYGYGYDDNLNLTSLTDYKNSSYSLSLLKYDGLDRLTETTGGSGIGSSSLTYDGLGNIQSYSSKDRSLAYSYDTDNKLTSVSGINGRYGLIGYDDRGNITANGSRTFTFNRANQLVTSGSNSYLYDGYNRRVKQTEAKGVSYSFYNQEGSLVYRETSQGGVNYVYLGKRLIAKDGFIPEPGGQQHYRPFGESLEGATDDVGYTGHKYDAELDLNYMQQRYYDPVIGRFYSNDPVDMLGHMRRGNQTMGFNRYAYVNNNPYKYIDRDGRFLFLAAVPVIEYTLGMAAFDGLVVGAFAWGINNSTSDNDADESDSSDSGDGSKKREKAKDRRNRQKQKAKEEKFGEAGEEPASEDYVKWKAREKEKRDGKPGRRDAHDEKQEGEPDRTKEQIDEDYK